MDKPQVNEFKRYRKTQIAEMRPVFAADIRIGIPHVSISEVDRANGSPKIGDMIARNPDNHADQWLVSEKFFRDNYAPVQERLLAVDQLIARQAMTIEELKDRAADLHMQNATARRLITCIGGPLNDNARQYNQEQLKEWARVLAALEGEL